MSHDASFMKIETSDFTSASSTKIETYDDFTSASSMKVETNDFNRKLKKSFDVTTINKEKIISQNFVWDNASNMIAICKEKLWFF